MNIRLGDKVKFVDDVGGGTVVRLESGVVTVEDEHGFHYDVPVGAVISGMEIDYHLNGFNDEIDDEPKGMSNSKQPSDKTVLKHHKGGKVPYLEVDLHIHHLMSGSHGVSNHDMVVMQMNYMKQLWNLAKKYRYIKIVFIHGVGEGKLRYEIHQFLNHQSNCEYFDANIQTYGYGATEVKLWYN